MPIRYQYEKALPCDQLKRLFTLVGWSDGAGNETEDMRKNFNLPFINSRLVVSAWEEDRLIGAVRALSDEVIRSVIYDLLVDPEYHNRGIGKELVRRCIERFPNTEWLVETEPHIASYYEKLGFQRMKDVFLHIPSIYQKPQD